MLKYSILGVIFKGSIIIDSHLMVEGLNYVDTGQITDVKNNEENICCFMSIGNSMLPLV